MIKNYDCCIRQVEAAKAREQKYRDDSKTASTNVTVKRKPVAPVKKLDISMWEKQIQEMGKRGGAAAVDSEPVQKFDKKCSKYWLSEYSTRLFAIAKYTLTVLHR